MCLLTGGLERLLVEFSRLHDTRQFASQFVALDQLGSPAEDIVAAGCPVTSLSNVPGRWARFRRLSRL
ncbi:MAG: lipopolysaccharide biosynthesis protein, partial [Planctomycetaceae bacterium]